MENQKTLRKEIKEDLNKWRDTFFSWIGKLNIVKMSDFPTLRYRFNAISIKIPRKYFVDIDKLILNLLWKGKLSITSNSTEEAQCRRTHTTQFQDLL